MILIFKGLFATPEFLLPKSVSEQAKRDLGNSHSRIGLGGNIIIISVTRF
jgi:hypothetical protein